MVGGVLQAGASAYGASEAAGAQEHAADVASQTQLQMYNTTRNDLLPYNMGGQTAFNNLSSLLGMGGPQASANMLAGLQNYPGYQFALQQGGQAVDRSAASKGLMLSGGQLKDLTAYGQGMGSQLFNNYFNQNLQLSSLGEDAAAKTGNVGAQAASGAANAQLAGGQAAASGIAGITNAITGQNGLINNALQNSTLFSGWGGGLSGQSSGSEFGWT